MFSDACGTAAGATLGVATVATSIATAACALYHAHGALASGWSYVKDLYAKSPVTSVLAAYEAAENAKVVPIIGVVNVSTYDRVRTMISEAEDQKKSAIDLVLHTTGGDGIATRAIVKILQNFRGEIRVWVLHTALSAGTIIALCMLTKSKSIRVRKNVLFGPVDSVYEDYTLSTAIISVEVKKERSSNADITAATALSRVSEVQNELMRKFCLPEIPDKQKRDALLERLGHTKNWHQSSTFHESEMIAMGVPLTILSDDEIPEAIKGLSVSWTVASAGQK